MGSRPHSRKFLRILPLSETQGAIDGGAPGLQAKRGQMGDVIRLSERREALRRRGAGRQRERSRAQFFFDLSCPFTYLAAERVERAFDDVIWTPASSEALRRTCLVDDDVAAAAVRRAAEERAAALRLPLVWPERFPTEVSAAMRVAAFAAENGRGAAFVLAATRLAFCGGFDLDDPEILAEAAAAAGRRPRRLPPGRPRRAPRRRDRGVRPCAARRGRRPAARPARRARPVLGRAPRRRGPRGRARGARRTFVDASPQVLLPALVAGCQRAGVPGKVRRRARVDAILRRGPCPAGGRPAAAPTGRRGPRGSVR